MHSPVLESQVSFPVHTRELKRRANLTDRESVKELVWHYPRGNFIGVEKTKKLALTPHRTSKLINAHCYIIADPLLVLPKNHGVHLCL